MNFSKTYINTNFNINTIPTATVPQPISFHLPVNNFNSMYDTTPNTIPSDIEYENGIIIIVKNAGIASDNLLSLIPLYSQS